MSGIQIVKPISDKLLNKISVEVNDLARGQFSLYINIFTDTYVETIKIGERYRCAMKIKPKLTLR